MSRRRIHGDRHARLTVRGPFGDGPGAGEEGDDDYRHEGEGKYEGYVFHGRIRVPRRAVEAAGAQEVSSKRRSVF